MDIGEPRRTYEIEPLEEPVPAENEPVETPVEEPDPAVAEPVP